MKTPKHAQLVQDIREPHNGAFIKALRYIDLPITSLKLTFNAAPKKTNTEMQATAKTA